MLGVRNNLPIHDKARGKGDENAATKQQQHKLLPRGAGGGGGREGDAAPEHQTVNTRY